MKRNALCGTFAAMLLCGAPAASSERPPYPPSPVFSTITFEKETLVKAAPGSDQFGTTWAGDNNLYVAWGDGGGFGGTNQKGRSSLGVAVIKGMPPRWRGRNLWGGLKPLSRQKPIRGKTSSGVVAIGKNLYLYVVEQDVWTNNHLWVSRDYGLTWHHEGPLFNEPGGPFADPGIVQYGRAYRGAPHSYVYGFSEMPWRDGLALFRVPKSSIAQRKAYQFFAGFAADGTVKWTADIKRMKRVFTDPNGTEWGVTCVFHPTFRRYLLCVRHSGKSGLWGLFDAPEPWGPWTTVAYGKGFPPWTYTPDPQGASKGRPAWMHTFPAKWITQHGTTLWHIFDRGDQFNCVKAKLVLR